MKFKNLSRREFVKGSLSTLALTTLPIKFASGQSTANVRLEWQDFKTSPGYSSFIDAIRTMRANANQNDKASWLYWTNIHANSCPHGVAYFLAWHRGYIHCFQEQLRIVSGNSTLTLPYWDYYKNPVIPAEFTDAATGNPLYVNRVNSNVYSALTLQPFKDVHTNFQRGTAYAFETQIEYKPHGPIHNIIGGNMATKTSPMDPIFWLHHAQIDRLWAAWVAAGNGRQMPPSTDPYWSGSFVYNSSLTMDRNRVIDTSTYLGYRYQDETFPKTLPPQAQAGRIIRVQMESNPGRGAPRRPPYGNFALSGPRTTGMNRYSIGGALEIPLSENSVSVQIPVTKSDSRTMQSAPGDTEPRPSGTSKSPAVRYTSVQLILDNARMTPAGQIGGYYYQIYLNLPENGDASSAEENHLIGGVGPFEIASARHHGSLARLVFPITRVLRNTTPEDSKELTVSFFRVSGENTAKGKAIYIGEVRVELSNDPVE